MYTNQLKILICSYILPYCTQVWNDELAQFAQTYAEACIDGPNPNRNTASFSGIGENRGFSTRADVNYGAILQQFFNERTDYDFNTPSCISADHTCEEYRQVR